MSRELTQEDYASLERDRIGKIVEVRFWKEIQDREEHLERCEKLLADTKRLATLSGVAVVVVFGVAVSGALGWLP